LKKLLALFLLSVLFFGACRKNDKITYPVNADGALGTTPAVTTQPIISNAAIADYLAKNPIAQFVTADWSKARQATIDGKNIVCVPTINTNKSPRAGTNKLQVADTQSPASGITANYFPEHPPELFFIQDPNGSHPDSIYTMMVNFVPTDKNKEFGKDSIWTGKLYDWDLNSGTLHVQELSKSKVNKTYALVLNKLENSAHKQHINSVWSWLGDVLSDIWDAINYVAYYLGIPGAHIEDPNVPGGWLVRTWDFGGGGGGGGGSGSSGDGYYYSSDSPYSGQFFIDGVYSNYIPGYNGYSGSNWNPYPTGDPCSGGQNVASSKLKLQQLPGGGGPCNPTMVPVIFEPTDADLNITPDPDYEVDVTTPDNAHLSGEPAITIDPNADYYTSSEIDQLIANLQNGAIQEDPIEFYLILNYKGSKLLNTSIKSIASNNIQIGDYLLTPHYDSSNNLLFYAAWRNPNNGIEFIIRVDALTKFKENYKLYKSAADWFYLNGIPSKGDIQYAAGDYFKGLKTLWTDAIHSPQWWAYAITTFMHASLDFASPSQPNLPQPSPKTYLLGTTISSEIQAELNIPSNYTVIPSLKKDGVRFINPNNPLHDYVRVMPANPGSPNIGQQVPYVIRMLNGSALDINGNPVSTRSLEAHIPVTHYKFNR